MIHKKLLGQAEISFSEASTENHSLIFLLIEDHIVDVQLNGSEYQTDYEHKHVLRGAMEKALGEKVNDTEVAGDETFTVNSNYIDIDPSWDLDNCMLVGVLINTETLEVVQVQEMHI